MITAMILAGGEGSRVGADRPKQFIEIFGKPVIVYTIEKYQYNDQVDKIEIVCHEKWISYLKEKIEQYQLSKVQWIVKGGKNFQESVMNGMYYLEQKIPDDSMVMIHYGAAPFTSQRILDEAIAVCRKNGMSVSCIPCYQLMGTNNIQNRSLEWIDRDKLIQIACPQCFKYSYLRNIYKRAKEKDILKNTEPHVTSLMYALKDTIYQSFGDQTNIKITTKEDLELFEGYVLRQEWINKKDIMEG